MAWSEWHRFAEMAQNPTENCKMGVYQVRITSPDRKPVTVPRALGNDPDGILYIGCGYLADRVGRLLRIHEPNPKHHHNFISVYLTFGLEKLGDRRCLEIRWRECEDYAQEERRLLDEYKRRTGDIPPGNRKLEPYSPLSSSAPETDLEET